MKSGRFSNLQDGVISAYLYKLHNSCPIYLLKMHLTSGGFSLKMISMLILFALLLLAVPVYAMVMSMVEMMRPERVRVAAVVERKRR
jgi:hypothetical protein